MSSSVHQLTQLQGIVHCFADRARRFVSKHKFNQVVTLCLLSLSRLSILPPYLWSEEMNLPVQTVVPASEG